VQRGVLTGLDAQAHAGDARDDVRRVEGVGDTGLLSRLADAAAAAIADEERRDVPGLVRDAPLELVEGRVARPGRAERHRVDPVGAPLLGQEDVADLEQREVGEAARAVAVRDCGEAGQQADAQHRLLGVERVRDARLRDVVAAHEGVVGRAHERVGEHLGEAGGRRGPRRCRDAPAGLA